MQMHCTRRLTSSAAAAAVAAAASLCWSQLVRPLVRMAVVFVAGGLRQHMGDRGRGRATARVQRSVALHRHAHPLDARAGSRAGHPPMDTAAVVRTHRQTGWAGGQRGVHTEVKRQTAHHCVD